MRNDERLRTIYEVMAPYIIRNEHNWRDYLAFASQFHKHSFDNILLVYAQDEDVSILATRKQWESIGRNLIPRAKGVAVCVYQNAKLTLDYLFDVGQTTGKEIHPTDWQLSNEMKKALTERLSYAHGFPRQGFSHVLYAMASESVADNYSIFEERPHISMIEVLEDYRRQGIATKMLRYLQGQYEDAPEGTRNFTLWVSGRPSFTASSPTPICWCPQWRTSLQKTGTAMFPKSPPGNMTR